MGKNVQAAFLRQKAGLLNFIFRKNEIDRTHFLNYNGGNLSDVIKRKNGNPLCVRRSRISAAEKGKTRVMENFYYDIPTKVHFGKGQIYHLAQAIRECGSAVLLVYGAGSVFRNGVYEAVTSQLKEADIS